jgi:glycosyltransferase involved in cell wall biosynthesis
VRLLFVHDHRFFHDDAGQFWTSGSFPATVWDRYLRHFEEVRVLARSGGKGRSGQLALASRAGVQFGFLPSLTSFRQLLRPNRELLEQLVGEIKQADALVARVPSELGFLAAKLAKEMNVPYAVEVVGCAWDAYANHGSRAGRAYAPLAFLRLRRTVRDAPLALYVTTKWLQGRYPTCGYSTFASNVEILPLDAAGRRARDERLREVAAGRPPELGSVASLKVAYKGIQTAIAALATLRTQGLDLHYAVLGPGDCTPWRALARSAGVEDLVRFDGTRPAGEGVCQWLDRIDIHLQPSFQEGLPRATIEAMSRGTACIGSTAGGIPELLSPDRTHRPGDVKRLARCIEQMASEPAALRAASEAGIAASRNFFPDVLRARRDDLFGRLRTAAEQAGILSADS